MDTKQDLVIENLNKILSSNDEIYLLDIAFGSEDLNERFSAIKRLIEIRECKQNQYFDIVEKFNNNIENKEILHRVVECINDKDLLTPIMNNHKRYKSAIVAEFKLNDLKEIERLNKNPDDYENIVRFITLPYSLNKIIQGEYSDEIRLEAVHVLATLPKLDTVYNQIFATDYAQRVLEQSGMQIFVA